MEVAINSRHMAVPVGFREQAEEKLARLGRYDHRIIRVQVEVAHERNPRQADRAVRVELTAVSKGPVVRAEAAGPDQVAALDVAVDKMVAQMRRAADRRRVHRGRHTPPSVGQLVDAGLAPFAATEDGAGVVEDGAVDTTPVGTDEVTPAVPLVGRCKEFAAAPMTLDQALYERELVGHDFYLFVDADSGRPSVVYRRRGYDYGVVSLETTTGVGAVANAG